MDARIGWRTGEDAAASGFAKTSEPTNTSGLSAGTAAARFLDARSSRSWITVEPFWERSVAGVRKRSVNRGPRYRTTFKQRQITVAPFRDFSSSHGTALAMLHRRDASCPALTQERVMQAATDSPSSSRALVTVTADTQEAHPHRPIQRVSSFITQLIATARQLPQTRERRRADPAEVIAAYRATVERIQKLNEKSE
jgi:hypothetical protein